MDAFAPQTFNEETPYNPTPRWKSDTSGKNEARMAHSQLTAMALLQYLADMVNLFGMSGDFGYKLNEFATLQTYSEIPDKPTIYAWGDHFYNPDTGKSWNDIAPTAKARFTEYYGEALNYFSSNRALALQYLGKSLHFVQDVNEPHHASNEIAGLSQHTQFESFASTRLGIVLDNMIASPSATLYNSARNNSSEFFLHMASVTGKSYIEIANQPQSGSNWDSVADITLMNSERYTWRCTLQICQRCRHDLIFL